MDELSGTSTKNLYAGTSLVVGTIVTLVTRRAKFLRA